MCKGKTFYADEIIANFHNGIKTRYHPNNDRIMASYIVKGTIRIDEYPDGKIIAIIGDGINE